jgi:hypothetical protein
MSTVSEELPATSTPTSAAAAKAQAKRARVRCKEEPGPPDKVLSKESEELAATPAAEASEIRKLAQGKQPQTSHFCNQVPSGA